MRLILAMCVGVTLALNATVARSENPAASPTTVPGAIQAPGAVPAPQAARFPHEFRQSSAPRCVLPVMGYEYLYDPDQACAVSGYTRMFQF